MLFATLAGLIQSAAEAIEGPPGVGYRFELHRQKTTSTLRFFVLQVFLRMAIQLEAQCSDALGFAGHERTEPPGHVTIIM